MTKVIENDSAVNASSSDSTDNSWWNNQRFTNALRRRIAAEEPTQDEIRRLAYEIYKARYGCPGDALSDWLQAEDRLREIEGEE
jgi:hypothetical protein